MVFDTLGFAVNEIVFIGNVLDSDLVFARNSKNIGDVGEQVSSTSKAATDINAAIAEVNQSTAQIAESSHHVNLSAEDLSALAEELTGMVSRFRL